MKLKTLRLEKGLTQQQVADIIGVTRRTYITYENNENNLPMSKLDYIIDTINKYGFIDESHGILTIDQIKKICNDVFSLYNVDFAYLFGSYAKGYANETSDIDILISMPIDGMMFYEIIELLRGKLKKKVDLLDLNQLNNNAILTKEILKDGIKIYG